MTIIGFAEDDSGLMRSAGCYGIDEGAGREGG